MMQLLGFPMALQFSPDAANGYLYRKDQIGPAVSATAAERDRYVRWMGWMVGLGSALYFFGIILMSILADRFVTSDSDSVGVAGAIVMAVIALGSLYLFLRWASHAPARAFAGRPEIAPAKSRQQVFGRRISRMTYTRLASVSVGMSVVLLLGPAREGGLVWLAVGLPAAVGIALAIWKWRIEAE